VKWIVATAVFLTFGAACFLAGYGMGALALDVDWTRPRRTFRDELDGQDAGA
jgi:hypothetical protein